MSDIVAENLALASVGTIETPLRMLFSTEKLEKGNRQTKIVLMEGTTGQAINYFTQTLPESQIAAMNFANSDYAGGGYTSGCMAQEEEMCRTIPGLFSCLYQETRDGLYSKDKDDPNAFFWFDRLLYSRNLTVQRYDKMHSQKLGLSKIYDMLPEDKFIPVSVVTAAGPVMSDQRNLSIYMKNHSVWKNKMYELIYTSLTSPIIAKQKGFETRDINVFVGGAIGCGVFAPPSYIQSKTGSYCKKVANLFLEALMTEDMMTQYEYVCFAIPPGKNFDDFEEAFKESTISCITLKQKDF
jgi:uncharacterized protein (TIGR02452 family)